MKTSAWRPPIGAQYSRARAALGRALGREIAPLPLGGGLALRIDPLGPVAFDAASVLLARIEGQIMAVALSAGAHRLFAVACEAPLGAAQSDPETAAILAEAGLERALDGAEAAIGAKISVLAWSTGAPAGDLTWIAGRLLDSDGAQARVAFGVGEAMAARLAGWLAPRPAQARNDRAIGLRATLRFPPMVLSRAALEALRPGDTIFDELSLANLRLAIGPAQWRCAMSDDGVTKVGDAVEGARGALARDAGRPEAAAEGDGVDADLQSWAADRDGVQAIAEDAPVDARLELADIVLAVELARATLPLDEARRVGPGYVLPLGRGLGSEVDVMIADRRFGRGRLVEVEGEIAVEILRVG